ncbi:uncharacterized protein [Oryctolagus cuniculus]|uniref:Uncharacterized protein n=2 Tax=Oryctolagus cuniculus TaxID=9986 RepID=U3KMM9_RABIT|nr:uncharacterized protein LOC103347875 isoform X2 [Oryctolagus cuniculus]XP_017196560.1 uncharacterized protein LOC103347875 isoform X2 [Oryctolagus cuniculus]
MAGRTPWKSCTFDPGPLCSLSLPDGDPELLSPQLQAPYSRGTEPLSSPGLSQHAPAAQEYLPFFRTYGQLQDEEQLALRPAVYGDGGAALSQEDSAQPCGFFPYYHSQDKHFPSLAPPGWSHGASQDPLPTRVAQAGSCCRTSARDAHAATSAGSAYTPGSAHAPACCSLLLASAGCPCDCAPNAQLCRVRSLEAAGFVPYYRSHEERLRTSPGPPAPPSGSQEISRGLPRPGAATP